jgi:hypothetical protein
MYFPELDYVAKDVQIIKTTYNTLLERFESMEMGQPSVTLTSLIKDTVEKAILRQVPSTSSMEQAIEEATKLITGGTGGHVVIATDADGKPNEILIMDTDDVATAVHVLRINMNGIGFSSSGYEGPFTTAWTLDGGFVADFIRTGTLNSAVIDVDSLFARNITATGTITGAELIGSKLSTSARSVYNTYIGIDSGSIKFFYKDLSEDIPIAEITSTDNGFETSSGDLYINPGVAGKVLYINISDTIITGLGKSFQIYEQAESINVAANSTANGSFDIPTFDEEVLGIVGWRFSDTNSSYLFLPRLYVSGTKCYWLARNTGSSAYTGNLWVSFLLAQ